MLIKAIVSFAPNFYFSVMNKFKNFVEWNAFGVCSAIGARMGIATSRIRQYFIYASLLTVGSPIIIYMVLAFWRNMRRYMKAAKRNPWYYL
jgi:phage shock protein PspC (stress-responsive transcriptional regulator)